MDEDWRPVVAAALYALVALTATTWLPELMRRLRPKETRVTITDIVIYPVKSCHGVAVNAAMLDAQTGLADDRKWMFVDARGAFLSQRRFPRLCLVEATPTSPALRLEAPGMPPLEVPPRDAPLRQCRVWDDEVEAADEGDAAAAWISQFLDLAGARLVRFPRGARRQVDRKYASRGASTGFSDGFPLLLAASESLKDLNGRLVARGKAEVPMDRFRPNVVVSGAEPWAEDAWASLTRADGLELRVAKPCSRCKMPTVDQATGAVEGVVDSSDDLGGGPGGAEPVATLKLFRSGEHLARGGRLKGFYRKRKADVFVGQNLTHEASGLALRVGDVLVARDAGSCVVC